jgi:Calcineurin-like phosphoesterase
MADDAVPTGENLETDDREAKDLAKRLRKGNLPQMVDWFDPLVLGTVGVRTLISTTIGEYADQRPMQETTDGEPVGKRLVTRHDYSKIEKDEVVPPDADHDNLNFATRRGDGGKDIDPTNVARTQRRLKLDSGALWVDFIADLGDGFEATYAMAYLLAVERLRVGGVRQELPAGQILIWGGDLAYPNATLEEYRKRCLDPYDWAFTADEFKEEPDRELFFVAGNHDWYDGLSAFTSQFCYEASSVGAWRCRQERSYFALRLPYDWWIWGIDVALGDNIDAGQLHYFQGVVDSEYFSEKLNPKVIVILHAPDWTKPSHKALTRICELARQKAEVCAILAGDLHHYSRYQSVEPDAAKKNETLPRDVPLHLITSGGGGAFAHPTHDRTSTLEIEPAMATRRIRGTGQALKVEKKEEGKYEFRYSKFYPSKGQSRLLTLKNLWLPLHNRRFALLLGFVYLIYAWVFNITAPKDAAAAGAAFTGMNVGDAADVARAAQSNPAFFFMLLGLWFGLIVYVDANLSNRFLKWLNIPIKVLFGTLHYSAHVTALLYVSAFSMVLAATIFNPLIGAITLSGKVLASELLQGLYVTSDRETEIKTIHHCLAAIDWSAGASLSGDCTKLLQKSAFYVTVTALTFAAITVLIGGMIGGFIFGLYWVLTSALFGMHPDAFSALAIKDYKNFLRMKFEKDKLTIYPIALDRVPGPKEWRPWRRKDYKDPKLRHRPLLVPKSEMQPRLIEGPIEIKRAEQPPYADVKAYRPRGEG